MMCGYELFQAQRLRSPRRFGIQLSLAFIIADKPAKMAPPLRPSEPDFLLRESRLSVTSNR
jgi:hypothetical protein